MASVKTDTSAPFYLWAKRPPCPKCGGELSRVSRRLIDRLQSLLRPVHRYRCRNFSCQWVGNLPAGPSDGTPP